MTGCRSLRRLLPILLLALSASLASPLSRAQSDDTDAPRTITIGSHSWINYSGANLKFYGVLPRLVSHAYRLQGIDVAFTFFPSYEASLAKVDGKQLQGILALGNLKQWSDDYLYSDPIMKHKLVYYKRVYARWDNKSITNLYNKTIGINKN